MNRTPMIGKLEAVLSLAGLAYLGFWVYGLVMGVFEIDEMIGFSIVAATIVALFAVHAIRARGAMRDGKDVADEELERASRHQREVRGF